MVRPPKTKRAKPKTKRELPVARPTRQRGPSDRRTAPAATAPQAIQKLLGATALTSLGSVVAAKHVELTPEKLVDGNAFFIIAGYVIPRDVPGVSKATIMTQASPIHIMYPTLGLEGQELVVECEGDWPADELVEVNVGEVASLGDWTTSSEIAVKPKGGRVKFLTDTGEIEPGHLLGISLSVVRRQQGGTIDFFGTPMEIAGQVMHDDLTVHWCTIDQVAL